MEAAADRHPAADLVTPDDVQGLVHCHTVALRRPAHDRARWRAPPTRSACGYLTITDHSPAASYAGGLDAERLRVQWEEIARVQERVSVRLLRGTESDILADGALDYPDAVLEQLDVIIASVHARHRMDADRMTERIVRAMRHPCFKIWGHALGRLLLSRPPDRGPHRARFSTRSRSRRAAIEINGDPHRLDLEPRLVRGRPRARHPVRPLDRRPLHRRAGNLRYGVAMARRGWVRRAEVLNTLDVDAFARAVSPTGRGGGARAARSRPDDDAAPRVPAFPRPLRRGASRAPPPSRRRLRSGPSRAPAAGRASG